jgi:hypothetical protein
VTLGASRLALVCAVTVLWSYGLWSSGARAQTDEQRAAARVAAKECIKDLDEGRYEEALDYCKRAEAIMHAPTHLLLIARADSKLGRLVEAQEAYIRIQREPLASDAPAAFVDAQHKAAEEQAALAPRIPSLTVQLEGGTAADVTVMLDGKALPSAVIGLPGPVDPGEHKLSAMGATRAADPATVVIAEGAKETVTVQLKVVANAPADAVPSTSDEAPRTSNALRIGAWVGVGVGVVGLAVGTAFVVKNHSDRDDANALCTSIGCPESKRAQVTSFDNSANSAATLAWVSYGIGAAGLATGAVLFWLSGSRPVASQTARVSPWIGARVAGVMGTF